MIRQQQFVNACVLLSGGMDSVAALHWARDRYENVRAIGFRYGQPHQDAELTMAGIIAKDLSIPFDVLALADLFPRGGGLLGEVTDHDTSKTGGLNAAFVPGRNGAFLWTAAMHACGWFKGNIDLVFGPNTEDAAGFPDCRVQFLIPLAGSMRLGMARELQIVTPFIDRTKEQMLRSLTPEALVDVQRSWSCYRGLTSGPCGSCTACVVRSKAFAAVGVPDLSTHPAMFGGDPRRMAK